MRRKPASPAGDGAPAAQPAAQQAALRAVVLATGEQLRDLPWRATRDPWAVLVSECMLQQTQVARVVGPWRAFLDRFPDPTACAAAPLGDVLRLWAGLGYNRRAAQLHATARAVAERHGGAVPDSLEALLALPGLGPYTARAVLAFAFGRDVAVVDVNARRVLSRAAVGAPVGPAALQAMADALVPTGAGWRWNQAVLELGALYCRSVPRCDGCPLAACCAWRCAGRPEPDPAVPGARQSRFEGSDRQGRGRLVAALRRGPLPPTAVADACGWPDDVPRARSVAEALVREGLATVGPGGRLELP
jgi:A/G-specific adenine glycosylase